MKVSRVILIVVALHVLVIGGIFVFEGCSRTKVQTPELADNETVPGQAASDLTNTPAGGLVDPLATPTGLTPAMPEAPIAAIAPVAPAPVAKQHEVKKGDSLWKIAQSEGTTVAELAKANNLTKTSALKIGQKLTVPAKAPAQVVAAPAAPAPLGMATDAVSATPATVEAGSAYTVAAGDSLWKIANKNGTTVSALKKANTLTSDSLKVGQKLTVPAKVQTAAAVPATTVSAGVAIPSYDSREPGTYQNNGQTVHIVDNGESLALIAKKYGVKLEDLNRVNSLKPGTQIHYGQPIIIPTGTPSAAVRPAVSLTTHDATMAAPIVSVPATTMN